MNVSGSLDSRSMNSSSWMPNSTSSALLLPVVIPVGDDAQDNLQDTTENSLVLISNKPCGEALSSQTPAAVKLPGSLDALLYIVIVLMFYAFSIAVLMVKYIRREREEANLRNYYHEFVSRDKFGTAQYKNRQFMKRIFGKSSRKEDPTLSTVEEEDAWGTPRIMKNTSKHKNQTQTITRNGNTFSRLVVDSHEENPTKESFTFLGAKNQFCKNGFFGKKFCNKQLCSKCVSESAPTIDWGDGRANDASGNTQEHGWSNIVEVRLFPSEEKPPTELNSYQKSHQKVCNERNDMFDSADSIFLPIIECDSDKENEDVCRLQIAPANRNSEEVLVHSNYNTAPEEPALVSSCSLEVSELLANMPPLGAVSASNDMDTLDGLSNFESEAESQSLLNYSASIKGTNSTCGGQNKGSPAIKNKSASGEGRLKDLNDFLSERTSLLSCTLSIDDGEDEDGVTNLSSSKHHPNGLSLSNSNGRVKEDFKSNGKSILNSLSKSVSSDEDEVMKILSDLTMLTEESGVFKNLKYFLRSFSKHEEIEEMHEKSNLLPRETYFGPGSPKSFYGDSQSAVVPTKCDPVNQNYTYHDLDSIDDDLLNLDDCENYGNRWGYTYDEEDEIYSEGDRSSSFGEYCMGEASESQVIDISKPLVRRQLDSETRNGLSRAFTGLDDPWTEDFPPLNKPNPMLAGYGSARKETKV